MQEERSLVAFQNLTLASPPIYPTQSSDSEMVGPAVKELTSMQASWVSDRPSSWQKLREVSSRVDKLETDFNDMKRGLEACQSLLPLSDSTVLACLVDHFLHKRGFSPLEPGERKAWASPRSTSG